MNRRVLLLAAAWLATAHAHAANVYHCRAYAGGEFWSSTRCDDRSALPVRVYTVPDGMSWENRIAMAEQQKAASERLAAPPPPPPRRAATSPSNNSGTSNSRLCQVWEAEVQQLDALARQPHSAQGLEDIRERRRELRDKQFRGKC